MHEIPIHACFQGTACSQGTIHFWFDSRQLFFNHV
jgi:hypothetical protein